MTDLAAAARKPIRWDVVLVQLALLYIVGLRLWFDVTVSPMGDEAYYWMWGQHLAWSYFDHPPLDGWLQGLVAAIFGWSNLSVRLLSWFTTAGTLGIFWLWSARLAPEDRQGWFWHTGAIYLTIPTIALMASFAFHDHLLLFLVIASLYAFDGFAAAWEAGQRDWRGLYVAAILLGLAVLTKYNGVFLGLGYFVWIIVRPTMRPLFRTWQLWLAALLAVVIQAPVLYWNLTENLASFRFHLAERPHETWGKPNLDQAVVFLCVMVLAMSPVLFAALFRIPWLKRRNPAEARAISLSITIFVVGTLCWAVLSAYVVVFFHWNIVAYAALAPIAYRLLGRYGSWAHIAIGAFVLTGFVATYAIAPIRLFDPAARANYGWPQVAHEVQAAQQSHPGAFLAGTRYTYAAQLGFQLHRTDVTAFNPLPSENDYWWDAAAHRGQDALIVADRTFPIANARPSFASLEKLEDVPVTVGGNTVWTFEIWLGKDYGNGPG
ncbi:MAG TPA: glycosyltransferase family 39 protein [Devosia sp.]|jgi:4-amino-4-deoxy-L-arabinose transferase-like glycosyltransferase|nr:glycosyltransferase family 39 protein [Devosia sp.]